MDKQKELLFHDGTDGFLKYNNKTKEYTFILRTAGNISSAFMCTGEREYEMLTNDREDIQYYQVTILPPDHIMYYHFKIIENNERILFYDALGTTEEHTGNWEFQLTPGFFTPDWAKGAVMYQIMVDRFYNGDETNDVCTNEYAYLGSGVEKVYNWYAPPATDGTRQFYGGDLQGVIEKLDYLEKMGVQVIYLNPIFVSPSNHKYDTQDYDYVDPHFGKIVVDGGELLNVGDLNNEHAGKYKVRTTYKPNLLASNDLFIELVEQAHQRGIKIILDGVFNHCGSFHKWLDREKLYYGSEHCSIGAYHSQSSPYRDFFRFQEGGWPGNNTYEGWWDFDTLPKLNYEGSEKLCKYILEIGKKWVSPPYNADGWRLDVAADLGHSTEFNHQFFKQFRKEIKKANPDAIILAEHYGDANAWLLGDEWDTVMNYDGFMDPVSWFLTGIDKHSDHSNPQMRGDAEVFVKTLQYQMSRMQSQSQLTAMNELSNHDHSRFLTRTNRMVGRIGSLGTDAAREHIDKAIFKQGVIMQMTLPGAPTLYYGDEAGVCGWTDPDNRRTYPWGREDLELLEFYREAISIHKQNEVLKTGSYMPLVYEKNILCYGRFKENQCIVTVVNTGSEDREIHIPTWKLGSKDGAIFERLIESYREFYNCSRIKMIQEEKMLTLTIKAETAVILRKQ